MYHQLLTFRNSVFSPHCIYVLSMNRRKHNDYFSLQYSLIGYYKRGREC